MRISQHNVRDYYSTYFSRFQCEFYSTHGKQPLSKLNLNYFQLWAYLNKRQVTINYPKSLPSVRILYTRQAITKHNVRYYYLTYLNCFQCEYYSTHGKQPLKSKYIWTKLLPIVSISQQEASNSETILHHFQVWESSTQGN